MKGLLYYLFIYPLVALISRLPIGVLYSISSFAAFVLYRVIAYRKTVVDANLSQALPEKNKTEIHAITRAFYRSFCDMVVETIAFRRMSASEFKKHMQADEATSNLMDTYRERHIMLLAGHLGNWEWSGQSVIVNHSLNAHSAYHPLSNPYVDRLMKSIRSHLGMQVIPMQAVTRFMASGQTKPFALALVADQAAPPETAYWTEFLNRPASFFRGPGKLAIRYSLPVIYLGNTRKEKGKYLVHSSLLWDGNSPMEEDALIEKFVRTLEDDIRKQPEAWLWSHRKWKHKPPAKKID